MVIVAGIVAEAETVAPVRGTKRVVGVDPIAVICAANELSAVLGQSRNMLLLAVPCTAVVMAKLGQPLTGAAPLPVLRHVALVGTATLFILLTVLEPAGPLASPVKTDVDPPGLKA